MTTAREEGKRETAGNVTELVTGNKWREHWLSTTEESGTDVSKMESMKTKTCPKKAEYNRRKTTVYDGYSLRPRRPKFKRWI